MDFCKKKNIPFEDPVPAGSMRATVILADWIVAETAGPAGVTVALKRLVARSMLTFC